MPGLREPCAISIHALRVEGDLICTGTFPRTVISIHALRVEGDIGDHAVLQRGSVDFYPRPPGGGRLSVLQQIRVFRPYFYPRPPGGGRRAAAR